MKSLARSLGLFVYVHRKAVVLAWVSILLLALVPARGLEHRLLSGTGSIEGSQAERVERILQNEFSNPYSRCLYVTLTNDQATVEDPTFFEWIERAERLVSELEVVSEVRSWANSADVRLRTVDGRSTFLLVGLAVQDASAEEAAVPLVRAALHDLADEIAAAKPPGSLAVTGRAAITWDLNRYSDSEGRRAEAMALPLTLLLLLLAFGTPIAAGLPILIAVLATIVACAILAGVTLLLPISILAVNIVTMLGLALGIDYSLFLVSHFRAARALHSIEDSVAETVELGGTAVLYSGVTVMIGLLGLIYMPVTEVRSTGIGGFVVVMVTVGAALTLLPALLGILALRLDSPHWLSRPLRNLRKEESWERFARKVMARPVLALTLSVGIIAALAIPTAFGEGGFDSDIDALPAQLESRAGLVALRDMNNVNALLAIEVIVAVDDALSPPESLWNENLGAFIALVRGLQSDERVAEVRSAVSIAENISSLQYAFLYANINTALERYPEVGKYFVSADRSKTALQIVPASHLDLREVQELAADVAQGEEPPLRLEVGGLPVFYSDFDRVVRERAPRVLLFVVVATLLVLFCAFRSIVVPIKAVVLNLMSVAAGFGAVVAVFQLGWLGGFGPEPLAAIPLMIPVIIFCITFGLSMDYEIFLLSRIKHFYDITGDNNHATARGIATTASVITSAAFIMLVVFGAFVTTDLSILRMLGLGLAVAVLIDATIVRTVMVPALMSLAGHWNWYPGVRRMRPE